MKKELDKIYKDIKSVKIQGATNVAKSAIKAYKISPTQKNIKKLKALRPTEPLLQKALDEIKKGTPLPKISNHLSKSQERINKLVFKKIKNNDVIFTHCHSSTVVDALIYAKENGKKFQVYNSETRPLYQGRKTSRELAKAKIKVTSFTDSAIGVALSKEQGTKKSDKVFLGADAILKNGDVINKIGSENIALVAKENNIPVFIVSDSWKFTKKDLELEQRSSKEIWKKPPKKVKLKNPAFEKIPHNLIKAIISDLGIYSPKTFIKKAS